MSEEIAKQIGLYIGERVFYLNNIGGRPHIEVITIEDVVDDEQQGPVILMEEEGDVARGYILPSDIISKSEMLRMIRTKGVYDIELDVRRNHPLNWMLAEINGRTCTSFFCEALLMLIAHEEMENVWE